MIGDRGYGRSAAKLYFFIVLIASQNCIVNEKIFYFFLPMNIISIIYIFIMSNTHWYYSNQHKSKDYEAFLPNDVSYNIFEKKTINILYIIFMTSLIFSHIIFILQSFHLMEDETGFTSSFSLLEKEYYSGDGLKALSKILSMPATCLSPYISGFFLKILNEIQPER